MYKILPEARLAQKAGGTITKPGVSFDNKLDPQNRVLEENWQTTKITSDQKKPVVQKRSEGAVKKNK